MGEKCIFFLFLQELLWTKILCYRTIQLFSIFFMSMSLILLLFFPGREVPEAEERYSGEK